MLPILYIFLVLIIKTRFVDFGPNYEDQKTVIRIKKNTTFLFSSNLICGILICTDPTKPLQISTNCLEIPKNMFSIAFKCLETIFSINSNFNDSNKKC